MVVYIFININVVLRIFQLSVQNGIYTESDNVMVTVDRNDAPVVNMSADMTVRVGERVDLSGFVNDTNNNDFSKTFNTVYYLCVYNK